MGIIERKLREKERRREEIVDSAEKLFFEKGFDSCTMDELAIVAELSKATLYVYFKSKTDILLEINKRAINKLKEYFENAVINQKNGFEKVRALGKSYYEFTIEYPDYHKFITLFENYSSLENASKTFKNLIKLDKIMINSIKEGMQDGSIKDIYNPEALSKSLWAMLTGLLQMINTKAEIFEKVFNLKKEDFYKHFYTIINQGIKKEN
ncbi:MAG: TetR/AcrR family transcriptional regulator [Bacteroidales bacterium]|nr:TetR/AcrR family transcriptional regulator [Bacteroidales bacterium]MBN2758638.1 TetR/AcrR family transcriptional regulator [Bacteroidales bacterium]